jgi:hypothetical protein
MERGGKDTHPQNPRNVSKPRRRGVMLRLANPTCWQPNQRRNEFRQNHSEGRQ